MADRGIHLFVGTKKGAYVLDGDATRKKWKVRGPYHEAGTRSWSVPIPESRARSTPP